MQRHRFLCALLIASFAGAAWAADTQKDAAYQADIMKWRAQRVNSLKENWLPLVGLFWLKEGSNQFGSNGNDPVLLPHAKAPDQAGTFELKDGAVTVKALPGSDLKANGKPVTEMKLESDESEKPTSSTTSAAPRDAASKPSAPRAGEGVEAAPAGERLAEPVEERLADAIGRRPQARPVGHRQLAALPEAADDAHLARQRRAARRPRRARGRAPLTGAPRCRRAPSAPWPRATVNSP